MGTLDLLLAGVRAYVHFLIEHPNYLRMHLAEGYSWAASGQYRSGEQIAAWEQGIELTASLMAAGQAEGLIVDGDTTLMAKMMAAMQQVQIADWVDGGMSAPADDLIAAIQLQFRRSFVSR